MSNERCNNESCNRDVIPREVEPASQPQMVSGRGQAFNPAVIAFSAATGILRLRCASLRMTESTSIEIQHSFVLRHSCFVIFSLIPLAR